MYASRPSFWNCSRLSFVIASSAIPSTSSRVSAIVKRTMYCTASGRSLVPSDMGPTSLVADERDVLALEHGLRLVRRHARLLEDSTGSVRSLARVPGVRAGEEETRLATIDDHRRVPIQRGLGHLDPLHGADDRATATPLLNTQLGRAVVAGPDDGLEHEPRREIGRVLLAPHDEPRVLAAHLVGRVRARVEDAVAAVADHERNPRIMEC